NTVSAVGHGPPGVYYTDGTGLFLGGGDRAIDVRHIGAVEPAAAAAGLGCRGFFLLALLLAVDAQRRHRSSQQPLEGDRLAAVLALVDDAGLQPGKLLAHLAEQKL